MPRVRGIGHKERYLEYLYAQSHRPVLECPGTDTDTDTGAIKKGT